MRLKIICGTILIALFIMPCCKSKKNDYPEDFVQELMSEILLMGETGNGFCYGDEQKCCECLVEKIQENYTLEEWKELNNGFDEDKLDEYRNFDYLKEQCEDSEYYPTEFHEQITYYQGFFDFCNGDSKCNSCRVEKIIKKYPNRKQMRALGIRMVDGGITADDRNFVMEMQECITNASNMEEFKNMDIQQCITRASNSKDSGVPVQPVQPAPLSPYPEL